MKYPALTTSRDSGLKIAKPKVNFERYLNDVLLAKAGRAELSRVFLDGSALKYKTAYASYSRSGNTLFRTFLEQATGVWTGSDGDLNYGLHYAL
jgi:hypothetical protein